MGLEKVQKQGSDQNTRTLTCYTKIMVKKDWTTAQHLLSDYATDVDLSSCLYLPWVNYTRVALLCFHPCLVSVLFTVPSLLVVIFQENFLPLVMFPFLLLGSKKGRGWGLRPEESIECSLSLQQTTWVLVTVVVTLHGRLISLVGSAALDRTSIFKWLPLFMPKLFWCFDLR